MKNRKISALFAFIALICFSECQARSPWRPKDPLMPELRVKYTDRNKTYTIRDYHLEYIPLFKKFDKDFFMNHLLPEDTITYRTDESLSVKGITLKRLCEALIREIRRHKSEPKCFRHFTILKCDDFNFRTTSGLIILKYKDYPFVLKLFIKTAKTFMKLSEGIIPKFLFRMGGGINRHLS
ncbi:hypothetical protein H0X06_03185, partial [Candidatus Dependentiae bacterium]|nr:hypothetical protein [Candidatus Dependentiae bacterium]